MAKTVPNKTKKPALVIAKCSVLMTKWYMKYISIVYRKKKKMNKQQKVYDKFFPIQL